MNDYRERLELAGALKAFERARELKNASAMRGILEQAGFGPLEIESILWSKGENVAHALTEEEKKGKIWDAIIGRLGTALVAGLFLGGAFVFASVGGDEGHQMEEAMKDFRTPADAYYHRGASALGRFSG